MATILQVSYVDFKNKPHIKNLQGVYYDPNYGLDHHKVPSLMYIMLSSMQGTDLTKSGYITVHQGTVYRACTFAYVLWRPNKKQR